MDKFIRSPDPAFPQDIPLRNPAVAAFWAWLIPGAGHFYQGRRAKGVLFMTCILSTYFFGLALGEGKVVYASFRKEDRRFPYLCQVGVGLAALPAIIQERRVIGGNPPREPLWGGWMAPPRWVSEHDGSDDLAKWHLRLKGRFELATLYTMVAGLLNMLAIYDAYAGPVFMSLDSRPMKPPDTA